MSRIAAAVLILLSLPGILAAQEEEDPLTVEGEVGASVFFGNTDQTVVTTRTSVDWAGQPWALRAAGSFAYGEGTDDEGSSFVNKRAWAFNGAADYTGFGRLSPSITGRVESSLEKRIDLRVALGGGARFDAVRNDRTRVIVSLALLAEHTRPRDGAEPEGRTVGRWSGGFRLRRALSGGRVVLDSETAFHPEFATFGSFTFTSENSLAFELTEVVSLKLTLIDSYDSEAEDRGAETNNDGQLLFSVLSSF